MASFYNNYYRYYRPYPSANFKNLLAINNHSSEDKSSNENYSRSNSYEEASFKNSTQNFTETFTQKEKSSKYYSFGPVRFKNPIFDSIDEPIFEILGIQLYLDDIIILGLLFFLYQEGVQDEMLYIALILLLLS